MKRYGIWKSFDRSVTNFHLIASLISSLRLQMEHPVLRSYSNIQDNKGDNSNILLESLGLSSYKKNIDNEIEVLRSKNQITDVVEALNLYTSYSWNSFLRNVPLYEEAPIEAVLDSIDVRSLKASLNIYCRCDLINRCLPETIKQYRHSKYHHAGHKPFPI